MLEISLHSDGNGVFQKDIAVSQDISVKYLDYIIYALKGARLICNFKGRKSGYILTKKPSQITIFDIHSAFEPGICVIDCLSQHIECDRASTCAAKGFWGDLNRIVVDYFKSVTLEDLMKNQNELEKFQ